MGVEDHENQLELFDVTTSPMPRSHREPLGRWLLDLRYDQLVLVTMGGVIGLTVVFACGVERGKRLVRSERALLVRQQALPAPQDPSADENAQPAEIQPESAAPAETKKTKTKTDAPPARRPSPSRVASEAGAADRSRYAVQVITYSRPQWAKREVERLQATGERAFLVIRNGQTSVYVGPFPSKTNALEKRTSLKVRYHDCFVRTL